MKNSMSTHRVACVFEFGPRRAGQGPIRPTLHLHSSTRCNCVPCTYMKCVYVCVFSCSQLLLQYTCTVCCETVSKMAVSSRRAFWWWFVFFMSMLGFFVIFFISELIMYNHRLLSFYYIFSFYFLQDCFIENKPIRSDQFLDQTLTKIYRVQFFSRSTRLLTTLYHLHLKLED